MRAASSAVSVSNGILLSLCDESFQRNPPCRCWWLRPQDCTWYRDPVKTQNGTRNGTARRSTKDQLQFQLAGAEPRLVPTLRDIMLIRQVPVSVELVGDQLRSVYGPTQRGSYDSTDVTGLLESFAAIETAEDALWFVTTYGWLWLCREHGMPSCVLCYAAPSSRWSDPDEGPDAKGRSTYLEPVEGYLFLAKLARALIRLGSELHEGEPGDNQDWELVREWTRHMQRGFSLEINFDQRKIDEVNAMLRRQIIVDSIDEWITRGHCLISCSLDAGWIRRESPPRIKIATDTMATIGLQLMATIANGSLVECMGCQKFYERTVTINRKRKHFCEQCRENGTAERIRKQEQRARRRLQPN